MGERSSLKFNRNVIQMKPTSACADLALIFLCCFVLAANASPANAQGFLFTPEEDYEAIEPYASDQQDHTAAAIETVQPTLVPEYSTELLQSAVEVPELSRLEGSSRSKANSWDFEPDVLALPKACNLSEFLPEPGNQKFNDCVGWAVAYAAYSCQLAAARGKKGPERPEELFSPAFIYNQINRGNKDNGSYLFARKHPNAIKLVKERGCASLATMPYPDSDENGWKKEPSKAALKEAKNFTAFKHQKLSSLFQIKHAISQRHPVILSVYMDSAFRNKKDKSTYTWKRKKDHRRNPPSGHTLCAVGYDDHKKAIRLINSWGPSWKDGGYCWASYNNFKKGSGHTGIGKRYWCVEAHVIKLDIASTRSRDFVLQSNRKVYENSKRISIKAWQVKDIASTEDDLYVLNKDGSIHMLSTGKDGSDFWINLSVSDSKFGLSGKKVTMFSSDRKSVFGLTEEGEIFRYVVNDRNNRYWERETLPDNVDVAELNSFDNAVQAISTAGVYTRNLAGEWTKTPFSAN